MSAQPLAGITVVDLSRLLPGPLAAHLLADLGARVIKVEEPRLGDPVRYAPPRVEGTSSLAALLLSGVESLALDLKQGTGRQVLERLLERADVLLDTFRPEALKRLGLAPDELSQRYPGLVICSLTGWGGEGPYAGKAGHDLTYQAIAGTLAATDGVAASPAVPVADLVGAWSVVSSVLAALVGRQRTGRGTVIDASLFDAAAHSNLTNWAVEAGGAKPVGEALPLTGALPCYRLYPTADGGWLALGALEPHFWRRFCQAVGRRDLLSKQYERAARREITRLVAGRTRRQWEELLAEHDIPAEPVLSAAEARQHPQMLARGLLGAEEGLPRLAFPAVLDGDRPRAGGHYPELGEHTEAILAELGMEEELPRFRRRAGVGRRFSLQRLLARWVGP